MKKLMIIGAALAVLLVMMSAYVVQEPEQVVVTQFGKPVGRPISTPGLKFRTPLIQTVHRFEKRFMEWDGDPNQLPTRDKRFIWVNTYARWRITDPLLRPIRQFVPPLGGVDLSFLILFLLVQGIRGYLLPGAYTAIMGAVTGVG